MHEHLTSTSVSFPEFVTEDSKVSYNLYCLLGLLGDKTNIFEYCVSYELSLTRETIIKNEVFIYSSFFFLFMIVWIKRLLMVLGLYFLLSTLGLWDTVLDWLWEIPDMVVAAVIK